MGQHPEYPEYPVPGPGIRGTDSSLTNYRLTPA